MSTKSRNSNGRNSCMAIWSVLDQWFTIRVVHPVTCGVLHSDDFGFTPESIRLLDLEAIVVYEAHHHGVLDLYDLICGRIKEMPTDSDIPLLWNLLRELNDPNELEFKRRIICSEEQINLGPPEQVNLGTPLHLEILDTENDSKWFGGLWVKPWRNDENPQTLDLLKLWGIEYSWSPEKGDYWVQH